MSINTEYKKWLSEQLGDRVGFDEPMSVHTSFRVGGPADAYVISESVEVFTKVIRWAGQNKLPILVIGDGTNLLVKDGGIRGIVISMVQDMRKISIEGKAGDKIMVKAMAGARMQSLCRYAVDLGLEGMNFAAGIPGTVGGGIMMNAGTRIGSVGDVLDSVDVILSLDLREKITRKDINFSYRKVDWSRSLKSDPEEKPIIVSGTFGLKKSGSSMLKKEAEKLIEKRMVTQPKAFGTAGCFFKNPEPEKSAGELIERAGLKGKKIGGVRVSTRHANFIVNEGEGTAADILELKEIIQNKVLEMFNINLEPEVKIVGE
ncbi:MAG: UDP-N-acetylmuramate dehydrogenase [Desulfobacterales bacterium]|nr:UDP-N-acetylmuramate dehydrogenase [Desulfobacterales bacterium]